MYKILIADDEALMRKGLCTLIDWAKLGCQIVGTAENGLQAKQAVLDYQPDIIIADIKMPVMDGLELARWVCGAQRQIQIILLTAFADFSYAQQAIQYGVSDYVTKTGNMNDIVAAVERCKQKLDQQRLLHVDVGSRISSMLSAVLSGTLHHEAEIRQQAAALGLTASGYAVAVADLRSAEAMNPSPMLRAGLESCFTVCFRRSSCISARRGGMSCIWCFRTAPTRSFAASASTVFPRQESCWERRCISV